MTALLAVLLAAQPNPFLLEAKALYTQLDFEKCVARLGQASTQWQSSKDELRDIELYAGLCQLSLGRPRDAAGHFRTALRIDEASDLPPYTSPKAVELFLKVKKSMQAPPEPFPEDDLPPDAPKEPRLTPRDAPPPGPTRPGVFEKHPLPLAFGIGAGVAAAVGVGLGINARNLSIQANEARTDQAFGEKAAAAQANAIGANVAWGLAGAAAVTAVVTWLLEPRADGVD